MLKLEASKPSPGPIEVSRVRVKSILTRSSGYLHDVASHSLQPYSGCALGNSLCGVGCYMRHSAWVNRGRQWGSFVEVRENAAEAYLAQANRERAWARRSRGRFTIFMSSATEPFQPVERSARITYRLLEAMLESPPDELIVQTHSHRVADDAYLPLYEGLRGRIRDGGLRFHLSIESDRDALPDLPRTASTVQRRCQAAKRLKEAGHRVVITVAPLLPISDPEVFFRKLGEVANAVVIDHFIEGDGSSTGDGSRTRRTGLPVAMERMHPGSTTLDYRREMIEIAGRLLGPSRVGVGIAGFSGRFMGAAA